MNDISNWRSVKREFFELKIERVRLRVAAIRRQGSRSPIVLLHGFGSTKEDFADLCLYQQFDDRSIVAFDAPGCGATYCSDHSSLSIDFLQRTVSAVIEFYGITRFHLVGHSMGGLTALMYACHNSMSLLSFTNIEGNIAPEDCFLSRQIMDYPSQSADDFLNMLIERISQSQQFSHPLFAVNLRNKIHPQAVSPIFHSMVELSENDDLFKKFTQLSCPRMFVYGDENRSLSYLTTLQDHGAKLAEIKHSGHFPIYANPPALWDCMSEFIDQSEMACNNE